jgi:hypothetical protein
VFLFRRPSRRGILVPCREGAVVSAINNPKLFAYGTWLSFKLNSVNSFPWVKVGFIVVVVWRQRVRIR